MTKSCSSVTHVSCKLSLQSSVRSLSPPTSTCIKLLSYKFVVLDLVNCKILATSRINYSNSSIWYKFVLSKWPPKNFPCLV
uniref:Uncharacterized protein MANES_06G023800 n=1 Tax=Rhizophora mucronata TaxID=61149 RepID=A0A2P2J9S9_RHIMU